MKWIVRIVTEEGFRGLSTGYVGPFDTQEQAIQHANAAEDPEALVEAYIEPLYPPC